MKRIYLDMDGVLANFAKFACTWLGQQNLLDFWPNGVTHIDDALGLKKGEKWNLLPKETFQRLEPTKEFKEIVSLVTSVDPLFHICTSPGPWAWAATDKINWLRKYIHPEFKRYVVVKDKTCVAKPGAILIDDSDSNINAFIREGGQGVLVPQPWNRDNQLTSSRLELVKIRLKDAILRY